MLDNLLKISSISGAFLIFCGVLKLILFYDSFEIDIVDFLTISEIITSFLDDINILLSFGLVMLIIMYASLEFGRKRQEMDSHDYLKHQILKTYPYRFKYIYFFTIIIVLVILLKLLNLISYNYFAIYLILFSVFQILSYLLLHRPAYEDISENEEESEVNDNDESATNIPEIDEMLEREPSNHENYNDRVQIPLIISVIISTMIAVFLLALHDNDKVITNPYEVKIITENRTIECGKNKNYILLGKTDGYVFIKNTKVKSVEVLKSEDVYSYEFFESKE